MDTKEIETIERQKPYTMFAFETKEIVNSDRFQEHAINLLSKLDQAGDNLKELVAQPDKFEMLIQVYLQFDPEQGYFGFSLSAETLNKLVSYCQQIEWRNKQPNNCKQHGFCVMWADEHRLNLSFSI